ncbi:MAG: choice-of-anchor L domain-containing protein [Actinomycetota bacterium]|nr:choice-of-anchor L domain-containing protein [Actinomycetota bacterium]
MHRQITRRLALLAAATACSAATLVASAPAAVVPKDSADEIAQAIVDDPSALDLANTDWAERPLEDDPAAPGSTRPAVTGAVADAPLDGFPTSGSTFGILTTGDPTIVDSPNDAPNEGKAVEAQDNGAARGDTDHDITVLKIGVTVPAGANCVSLDYRFLSEEFPEFVGSAFNDAFIAELDTTQWSTSGTDISRPGDFATNTGADPVSVNGVGPVAVTEAEAAGTTYDAATGRVNTKAPIAPGARAVFLSIFDQSDAIYDSAVFLDRLAFITEDPSTCRPPEVPVAVPPPVVSPGPPPPPPPPSNVFTVGSSITFGANGTATVTVVVPGPGVVTASDGSASAASARARIAAKKKKPLIATTKVIATKAGPVKVNIKPSKAGKKVLRRKGRLRVKVRLTFTPTNGAPRSQVKSVTLKLKKKKRRH